MGSHTKTACHGPQDRTALLLRNGWTPAPRVVAWLVTTRCEHRCAHCLVGDEEAGREPSFEAALGVVDQVAGLGVEELLLTGGEPLDREDLPELVAYLGRRAVPYSINSARCPSPDLVRALERNPPLFAAVSLDGPRALHDALRGRAGSFDEALASIELFRRLGVEVAAGTTVTRRNLDALPETLEAVVRSRAVAWGIHLLVPEGRARERPGLFLRPRELRRLLRFVAAKRTYLRVEVADELGFCGDLEPLLRDLPASCGAGRTQCVVLPDGEVVPCTTFDRTESAGNLFERPLGEIWREGFAELRSRRPPTRCRSCEAFAACGGGCWLQRRRGDRCVADLWGGRAARAAAAGAVLALGLAGGAACSSRASVAGATAAAHDVGVEPSDASPAAEPPVWQAPACLENAAPTVPGSAESPEFVVHPVEQRAPGHPLGTPLDAAVLSLTLREVGPDGPRRLGVRPEARPLEPAWAFVEAAGGRALPTGLEARAALVRATVCTGERSLGLAALLWRALAEEALDGAPVEARPAEATAAARAAMLDLAAATDLWRRDVFVRRLEPFLVAGGRHPVWAGGWRLKSGPPRAPWWLPVLEDTAEERWGPPRSAEQPPLAEAWLEGNPYAAHQRLRVVAPLGTTLTRPSGRSAVGGEVELGIHDLLELPGGPTPVRLEVGWLQGEELLPVEAPASATLLWPDLVRLAAEQHADLLRARARARLEAPGRAARAEVDPLTVPALREAAADSRAARALLADFWLF